MKIRAILISILTLAFSVSAYAQSCPMCKESMTNAGAKLSNGFFLSIMSLFILPFALIGGVTAMVFKSWWEKNHPNEPFSLIRAIRNV
jgi:hypothetical protein